MRKNLTALSDCKRAPRPLGPVASLSGTAEQRSEVRSQGSEMRDDKGCGSQNLPEEGEGVGEVLRAPLEEVGEEVPGECRYWYGLVCLE